MEIIYHIVNKQNEVLDIAIVSNNGDDLDLKAKKISDFIDFLPDDMLVDTVNGNTFAGINTVGDIRVLLNPPKCVHTHAIFKTDSNNIGVPENWDLIGIFSPNEVEDHILKYDKKNKTDEKYYPVVTIIQVQ